MYEVGYCAVLVGFPSISKGLSMARLLVINRLSLNCLSHADAKLGVVECYNGDNE